MSSLLGHIAAGTAIYFSHSRLRSPHTPWALPCFILLAILPDFDYFAIWTLGLRPSTRVTHTLLFCFGAGLAAWCVARRWQQHPLACRPLGRRGFILAPLSHLLLDFLVGAHTLPILWPLPFADLMSPVALLPPAVHGRSLLNYDLWRNTILEALILVPLLLFAIARMRAVPATRMAGAAIPLAALWGLGLAGAQSLAS